VGCREVKKLFILSLNGVLYDSVGRVLQYLRDRHNIILPRSAFHTNDLSKLTEYPEVNYDLVRQISNPEFYMEMKPTEGAWEAVELLSKYGNIISVTRRPPVTRMATRMCATRDFGPYIKEIYHQKNGPKVARHLKASLVVEDNPQIAAQYANSKIVTFTPVSPYSSIGESSRYLKRCDNLLDVAKMYDAAYSKTSWED
jgi:5'(3')-deoxyribonucleotidase